MRYRVLFTVPVSDAKASDENTGTRDGHDCDAAACVEPVGLFTVAPRRKGVVETEPATREPTVGDPDGLAGVVLHPQVEKGRQRSRIEDRVISASGQ